VRAETNPTAWACWNDAEASASSDASASCYGAPKDVRVFTIVESELKFREVERQILLAHVMVRPDHATLEQAPEVIDIPRKR
jgi:hypothetical protein